MPFQHPEELGYGYVIERYAARKDSGHARYLVLKSGRFLRPEWAHAERFAHHLIDDSATITDAELEALLGYEWRSRLTAAWLIGVPSLPMWRKPGILDDSLSRGRRRSSAPGGQHQR
ncbi:DUF6000 family protein, partial [Streptomyces sp. NPDC048340]|uniref:DUF6000 family protein n=1 Tax=Streptomyces sp. NPDC048340 TaxID=3365537 RepID=UPI003720C9AB